MLRHAARLSSRFAVRPRAARPLSTIDMGDTSVSARFREPDPSKPRIVPTGAETTPHCRCYLHAIDATPDAHRS